MRGVPRVFLLLAAGALLAGCAELSAPPSLQASFEEPSAAAAPGEQITATLKVASSNYSGQVRLTLVEPAGFTLMEPTAPVPITAAEQRIPVRVAVGGTVPAASYTLRFRVDAQGLQPIFASLPVMVQAGANQPAGVVFEGARFQGVASDEAVPPPSATLSYRASGGFRGLVVFQPQVPGWSFAPATLRVDQDSGTFTATLTPPPGTGPGTYSVPVQVQGYDFQGSFTAQVTLSGFTVSLATSSLTLSPTAVLQGSITLLPGFPPDAVFTLSLEGPDAGRFTLGANAFPAGAFSTSLSALPGTPPGTYSAVLRVAGGGAVRKLPLTLSVQASGLSASVQPSSFVAYAGGTASLTLQLTPQGGFSGWVLLGVRDPATGGAVSWAYVDPGAVYLNPGAAQSFALTLNLAPGAPSGIHSLEILVYGPQVVALPVTVNVQQPSFQIALSKAAFTTAPGGSDTATLSLTLEGPFTAPIALSLAGTGAANFTVAPASLDPSVPAYGLVITAASTTPSGTYDLVLTATGGGVTRTVPITVTVP